MTPDKIARVEVKPLSLDSAIPNLQRLLTQAAAENRHGEIRVIFKLVEGKITLIKHSLEFTTK